MPVDTCELARFLVGKMLVRTLPDGLAGGRIVETEAYPVGDATGHAYRGITPRNRALFLERGHAYVYLAYGISFMLNVSSVPNLKSAVVADFRFEPLFYLFSACRPIRSPSPDVDRFLIRHTSEMAGVLIRAIEPTDGIAVMKRARGIERLGDLACSPGRLCAALEIDRRLDGIDLCQVGPLWLGSDGRASGEIGQSKRIGITRAADCLLRFYLRGNRFVSGPQTLNT